MQMSVTGSKKKLKHEIFAVNSTSFEEQRVDEFVWDLVGYYIVGFNKAKKYYFASGCNNLHRARWLIKPCNIHLIF